MPASPHVLAHHRDRAKSRLRENVRQAALNGADHAALADIVQRTVDGRLSLTAANDAVLALRRQQAA